MVQPIGGFVVVDSTYLLSLITTTIHLLILKINIISNLDKRIHFWLDPHSSKFQRLWCSRSFDNSYFDVIPLWLKETLYIKLLFIIEEIVQI